ncbi:hypothetical protein BDZ45DRAFT_748010 [Acephala macrosclerotiorum]|nr:hypothetical protein BDZ45DRAFT_748010 [Acephala macrosclerotiorum]
MAASLTNVIGHINNVAGSRSEIERPLEWPQRQLTNFLEECHTLHTPHAILCRHKILMKWLREREASRSPSLERLCVGVVDHLIRAVKKMEKLRVWADAAGEAPLPNGALSDRHIVISSLQDILEAFKLFSIVSMEEDFEKQNNKMVMLEYARRTYALMIILLQILYPYGSDLAWSHTAADYLRATQLWDLKFDNEDDYERNSNPTCDGVIIDQASVPEPCRPAYHQPPIVCRNPGPYGSRLLLNLIHSDQRQDWRKQSILGSTPSNSLAGHDFGIIKQHHCSSRRPRYLQATALLSQSSDQLTNKFTGEHPQTSRPQATAPSALKAASVFKSSPPDKFVGDYPGDPSRGHKALLTHSAYRTITTKRILDSDYGMTSKLSRNLASGGRNSKNGFELPKHSTYAVEIHDVWYNQGGPGHLHCGMMVGHIEQTGKEIRENEPLWQNSFVHWAFNVPL